jgi:uncharacterized membrane protein
MLWLLLASGTACFEALRALIQNQGSRLMLGSAFLWSITSNFDKVGTLNSSPLFWAVSLFSVIALGMLPFVLRRGSQGWLRLAPVANLLTLTGLLNATGIGLQFAALTLAPVAQVIAVKRMSVLIAVVLGHLIFKETGLRERLLGAAVMVSGVVVMTLD